MTATGTEVSIPPRGGMDWDEYQEMVCLMLEGHQESEARALARSANDRINSRRLSGPITGDTKNGHGHRPYMSDMTHEYFWQNTRSLGTDSRTIAEKDDDYRTELRVLEMLEWLTPRQRELLTHKYGLGVEPAGSREELGARMGCSPMTTASMLKKIRAKVVAIDAAGGPEAYKTLKRETDRRRTRHM